MTVAIACDHGGYALKDEILKYLFEQNIEVMDLGTDSAVASVDYPDFAEKCAQVVRRGEVDMGIVMCGTGIGISIAANKLPGIRCALVTDVYSAKLAREHNNANMCALGGRVTGPGLAVAIVDAFVSTPFSGEDRHERRISKIAQLEEKFKAEGGAKLGAPQAKEGK